MFASPKKLLATAGLMFFSLGSAARADWPQSLVPNSPNWGYVQQVAGQEPLRPMPMPMPAQPMDVAPPVLQQDDLTEAGLLLPGPAQATGVASPQPMDYLYPARSARLYDEVGSQLPPEILGPASRPEYPYRATEYWDGHDAFVEEWGDLLELPYVRLGWFANVDVTAMKPRVSANFNSGTFLQPTFADPVTLRAARMDWNIMPHVELGYRYEHGLGELKIGYRYLSGQGTEPIAGFDTSGFGALNTTVQTHILDFDLQYLEYNAEGLPLIMPLLLVPGRLGLGKPLVKDALLETPLEYRYFFGIRTATMFYDSRGAGNLITEQVTNNFTGAGLHFGMVGDQRLRTTAPWYLHWKVEGSGMFGTMAQNFSRTRGGATASGGFHNDSIGVPTVDCEIGLAYAPQFPDRNVRFTLAYRFEEWFSWADTDVSMAEMYYSGVVLRGEYKY